MEQKYISNSQEETWKIAEEVLKKLEDINVIALQGELGAGKTTFAQGLLHAAGAEGPFTSPTFVIMKKYPLKDSPFDNIYHLDCYRVASDDVQNLGWQEIINNPKNLILVEWPEKIEDILPKKYMKLDFAIKGENEREIKLTLN